VLRNDTVKALRLYNVCDNVNEYEDEVFVE
jgi:hypothetical protein